MYAQLGSFLIQLLIVASLNAVMLVWFHSLYQIKESVIDAKKDACLCLVQIVVSLFVARLLKSIVLQEMNLVNVQVALMELNYRVTSLVVLLM